MYIYVILHTVLYNINIFLLLSLRNSTRKLHSYLMVAGEQWDMKPCFSRIRIWRCTRPCECKTQPLFPSHSDSPTWWTVIKTLHPEYPTCYSPDLLVQRKSCSAFGGKMSRTESILGISLLVLVKSPRTTILFRFRLFFEEWKSSFKMLTGGKRSRKVPRIFQKCWNNWNILLTSFLKMAKCTLIKFSKNKTK